MERNEDAAMAPSFEIIPNNDIKSDISTNDINNEINKNIRIK